MTPDIFARIDEAARRSADRAPQLTDTQRFVISAMFRGSMKKAG